MSKPQDLPLILLCSFSLKRDAREPFSLAPLMLAANLNVKNTAEIRISVSHFSADVPDFQFLKTIYILQPFILGISTYLWNIEKVIHLSNFIKKVSPKTILVAGGPEAGNAPQMYISHFDAIVSGEAEDSFNGLVDGLLRESCNPSNVPNVFFKLNKPRQYKIHDMCVDLNNLKSPFLSNFVQFKPEKQYSVDYEASRGCPFNCDFCTWAAKKLRFFPIDKVKEDIDFIFSHANVRALYLNDSNLLINKEYGMHIIEYITTRNIHNAKVVFNMNSEFLDDEIIALLSKGKNNRYSFGLQSMNPKTQKAIERKFDKKVFSTYIYKLRDNMPYDNKIHIDMIYGLPGESIQDVFNTINFALSFKPDDIHMYPLLILPGSPISYKAEKLGIAYNKNAPHEFYYTPHFIEQDVITAKKISIALQYILKDPAFNAIFRLVYLDVEKINSPVQTLITLFDQLLSEADIKLPLVNDIPLTQDEWKLRSTLKNTLQAPTTRIVLLKIMRNKCQKSNQIKFLSALQLIDDYIEYLRLCNEMDCLLIPADPLTEIEPDIKLTYSADAQSYNFKNLIIYSYNIKRDRNQINV